MTDKEMIMGLKKENEQLQKDNEILRERLRHEQQTNYQLKNMLELARTSKRGLRL